MIRFFRRFAADVRRRRFLDAYAVGFLALIMTGLTIFGDNLRDDYRWAVVFAGIGILVLRLTTSANRPGEGRLVVGDRAAFDDNPIGERLKRARQVDVFAPSAVNLLHEQVSELLRTEVLAHSKGRVRVVVLDPEETDAVALAVRQLDESLDYQRRDFRADLSSMVGELRRMAQWDVEGRFGYGFLPYNPGFSLVVLNRNAPDAVAIVEIHGFHNETTATRMHFEFTKEHHPRWFGYWAGQFEHVWDKARVPEADEAVAKE